MESIIEKNKGIEPVREVLAPLPNNKKNEKKEKKRNTYNNGFYVDYYFYCCDFCTSISPCEETCYNCIKLCFLYLFIVPLLVHASLLFINGIRKMSNKKYLFLLSIPIQCTLFISYEIPISLFVMLETLLSFVFPPLMQYTPLRIYK